MALDTDVATQGEDGDRGLLSDQIRAALADDIASGRLKPGAALDEQQLADRFGASRTPVREALRQLAAGGLVQMRPRRGVIVSPFTVELCVDMFEMTAEMEAMCVRLATHRITAFERASLQSIHERASAAVGAGDIPLYERCNLDFHDAIYAATHNRFMAEQAMALRERLLSFRRMQLHQSGRLSNSHAEHGEILAAMARGDGDEAARRMRAHLLNASGALVRYVQALQQT